MSRNARYVAWSSVGAHTRFMSAVQAVSVVALTNVLAVRSLQSESAYSVLAQKLTHLEAPSDGRMRMRRLWPKRNYSSPRVRGVWRGRCHWRKQVVCFSLQDTHILHLLTRVDSVKSFLQARISPHFLGRFQGIGPERLINLCLCSS